MCRGGKIKTQRDNRTNGEINVELQISCDTNIRVWADVVLKSTIILSLVIKILYGLCAEKDDKQKELLLLFY